MVHKPLWLSGIRGAAVRRNAVPEWENGGGPSRAALTTRPGPDHLPAQPERG